MGFQSLGPSPTQILQFAAYGQLGMGMGGKQVGSGWPRISTGWIPPPIQPIIKTDLIDPSYKPTADAGQPDKKPIAFNVGQTTFLTWPSLRKLEPSPIPFKYKGYTRVWLQAIKKTPTRAQLLQ